MPRITVVVNENAKRYPTPPVPVNSLDFAFTAGDSVNGLEYVASGREVVLIHNTNVGAQTFTLLSVVDEFGRKGGHHNVQPGRRRVCRPGPAAQGIPEPGRKNLHRREPQRR